MNVLASTLIVVEQSRHVRIDPEQIALWAERHQDASFDVPSHPPELIFRGQRHEAANFVLLQDCLNFCFWSDRGPDWQVEYAHRTWTRYFALVACLLRAVASDRSWLSADRWLTAMPADMEHLFRGRGQLPLLDRRLEILHETGSVLNERYGGRFIRLVDELEASAPAIARRLARDFPSFYDVARYRGRKVAFLKRAQICAVDLAATFEANRLGTIHHLDRLTALADYRLPQILRHLGILRVSQPLADRIDAGVELAAGSEEETELRANTIWAVEQMRQALAARGRSWAAWQIDNALWHLAHDPSVTVLHHRTRTICY